MLLLRRLLLLFLLPDPWPRSSNPPEAALSSGRVLSPRRCRPARGGAAPLPGAERAGSQGRCEREGGEGGGERGAASLWAARPRPPIGRGARARRPMGEGREREGAARRRDARDDGDREGEGRESEPFQELRPPPF